MRPRGWRTRGLRGCAVVSTRGGAVVSPAGTYPVRVRQAYDTELWAAIPVDVRGK